MRANYIDALKGLGIYLVILGHIANPFNTLIYAFHMPLFFFIAGFFIKYQRPPLEFIKSEMRALLLPYLGFMALALITTYAKCLLLSRPFSWEAQLKGALFYMDFAHLDNYGFILWFLPALFVARVFGYYVLRLAFCKAFWLRCLGFALFLGVIYLAHEHYFYNALQIHGFDIETGLFASLYVVSGFYAFRTLGFLADLASKERYIYIYIVCAPALAMLIALFRSGACTPINMSTREFGNAPAIAFALLTSIFLLGSFYVIGCFKTTALNQKLINLTQPLRTLLLHMGKYSLLYFALSPYVNNVAFYICYALPLAYIWQSGLDVAILYAIIRGIKAKGSICKSP